MLSFFIIWLLYWNLLHHFLFAFRKTNLFISQCAIYTCGGHIYRIRKVYFRNWFVVGKKKKIVRCQSNVLYARFYRQQKDSLWNPLRIRDSNVLHKKKSMKIKMRNNKKKRNRTVFINYHDAIQIQVIVWVYSSILTVSEKKKQTEKRTQSEWKKWNEFLFNVKCCHLVSAYFQFIVPMCGVRVVAAFILLMYFDFPAAAHQLW